MSQKFDEYPAMIPIRLKMRATRNRDQLSYADVSQRLQEETGYPVTPDQYRSIEQGITKNVPLWLVIGFMRAYNISLQDMFPTPDES